MKDLPVHNSRERWREGKTNRVRPARGRVGAEFSSSLARALRMSGMALVAAIVLLTLGVTRGSAQATVANSNVADSKLTVKIDTALWSDLRFWGKQISVETERGVVTLRGKVDSEETKKVAAEIVRRIEGVKQVRNELEVVPPERRAEVDARDQAIARALEEQLKQDPQLQNAVIDARVDAGVVTLRGQVPGPAASSRAVELARGVPGVRSVKNELSSALLSKPG
jgi:hyperosmotically inducible protein